MEMFYYSAKEEMREDKLSEKGVPDFGLIIPDFGLTIEGFGNGGVSPVKEVFNGEEWVVFTENSEGKCSYADGILVAEGYDLPVRFTRRSFKKLKIFSSPRFNERKK